MRAAGHRRPARGAAGCGSGAAGGPGDGGLFAVAHAVVHPRNLPDRQIVWRREQLTANIEPRVFQEQFPNTILFVADVVPGPVAHWKNVFLADLNPAGGSGVRRRRRPARAPWSPWPARRSAVPDAAHNRIQLSLIDASSHQPGKDPEEYFNIAFPRRGSGAGGAAAGRAARACLPGNRHPAPAPAGARFGGCQNRTASEAGAAARPASCWRWWGFRWGSPRARPASPRRW